jgi:hypothetical protein
VHPQERLLRIHPPAARAGAGHLQTLSRAAAAGPPSTSNLPLPPSPTKPRKLRFELGFRIIRGIDDGKLPAARPNSVLGDLVWGSGFEFVQGQCASAAHAIIRFAFLFPPLCELLRALSWGMGQGGRGRTQQFFPAAVTLLVGSWLGWVVAKLAAASVRADEDAKIFM